MSTPTDNLSIVINGVTYAVSVDRSSLLNIRQGVDVVHAQRNTTDFISAHTNDGTLITVAPDGCMYQDGTLMGAAGNKVSEFTILGRTVYGRGLSDGKWWQWVGSAWAAPPVGFLQSVLATTP